MTDKSKALCGNTNIIACHMGYKPPTLYGIISILAIGKFGSNLKRVIISTHMWIDVLGISFEIDLNPFQMNATEHIGWQVTMVHALAWCRQATIH